MSYPGREGSMLSTHRKDNMKEYKVGDTVLVPCTVVAVHPQGFVLGLYPNGKPRLPEGHEKMTDDELASFLQERLATVVALTSDLVEVDAAGHVHFSADAAL